MSRNSVSQHFLFVQEQFTGQSVKQWKPFNRVTTCFLLSVIKDGDDLLMSRFATISIHPLQGCYPRRWGLLKLNRSYFLNNMRQFLKTQWPESHQRKLFFFLNFEDISLEPVQNSSRPDGRSDWTFKGEQQLLIEMYGKIPKSVRGTLLPADQRAKVQHDCLRHMRALFLRCDLKSYLETDPMIDKHR